jgi:outer membrane protein TolC
LKSLLEKRSQKARSILLIWLPAFIWAQPVLAQPEGAQPGSAPLSTPAADKSRSSTGTAAENKPSPDGGLRPAPAAGSNSVTDAANADVKLRQQGKETRITPVDLQAKSELLDVVDQATKTSGAIFADPEKINVKPPLLSALITLDQRMSPIQLDARSNIEVSLHDVLMTAMSNNLPIKISQAESDTKKWGYYGALSGFLPNLSNELGYQYLTGDYVSPAGLAIPIRNPYFATSNSFSQYLYKGGGIIHGALQAKHQYKASQAALSGTINDVLQNGSKLYYDLVLNDVLLQIRIKAVEVSRGLVIVNEDQFANGANTQLDVLQAKYQLSDDRQQLIAQQIARRESAVNLAAALNADTGIDLLVKNRTVGKVRLIDERLMPADLLKLAVDNRPDLKRYEQLRLAAKEAIKVAKATLLPSVAAIGNVIGTGSNVRNISNQQQTTPLSSSGTGIGVISSASSLPLSGSTSGPSFWTGRSLFEIGLDVQWNLHGLGLNEYSQVQSARYTARRVQLEGQYVLEKVYKEVRDSFLSSISAENLIVETTAAVKYAEEGLRLAEVRFKEGVGTYVDVLTAQRNYTAALINKANAIIKFNVSQVDLLHAIGRLTVDTAVSTTPIKE